MSSINPLVQVAQQMLLGGAVKQNHALEHATIVLLSKKYPDVRLAGISFAAGFFVFGDVPTEVILPTAQEALTRLRERYRQTVERSDADIAHLFRRSRGIHREAPGVGVVVDPGKD